MTKQIDSSLIISENLTQLEKKLSINNRLHLIQKIVDQGEEGEAALLELLINRLIVECKNLDDLDGILFEFLNKTKISKIKLRLNNYFENGLMNLKPSFKIYQPLQELLINHKFEEADRFTQRQLCNLVGLNNKSKRNWLYFTDVFLLPEEDLLIIDLLWRIYSRGKFGFSVQRQIWLSNNCEWEKFWSIIGWENDGTPFRYPTEFMWNLKAPYGHLPLFNQLRGVQVLSALFNHISWTKLKE